MPDNKLESSDDHDEIMQASLSDPVSESKGLKNVTTRSGLSPSMNELIGKVIEKANYYPTMAIKRGVEGTVYVSFRINESGKPDDIKIQKSSGHSVLDSTAVKVVKKAGPYPYGEYRVDIPVTYKLRK